MTTIEGWLVMVPETHGQDPVMTSFQMADPVMKNVYRFRDSSGDTHL